MDSADSTTIDIHFRGKLIRLRTSLFWDVRPGAIDPERNRRLIMERVFSRGNIQEFRDIQAVYSREEIKSTVVQIGTLDKKTQVFLSKNYSIPISDFKCYTPTQ